jgi:hypothetical protein
MKKEEVNDSLTHTHSNNRIFIIIVVLIITTARNEFLVVVLNKFGDFSFFSVKLMVAINPTLQIRPTVVVEMNLVKFSNVAVWIHIQELF